MRVAIVHYWLFHMRGGEKVLEALCEVFPNADIYTHVYDPTELSETITRHCVKTTFIQRLPKARSWYQKYLPLMPLALEELDLTAYDLVISSESGPTKGVVTRPDALHVCYCHSPMRYLWDQYHVYKNSSGRLTRFLMPWLVHRLRIWDVTSATRVDHFIANSNSVAARIRKFYRREALVIHPPCDVDVFEPAVDEELDEFYLMVGQLVPYKRPDLAIEAFNRMGKSLIIIGDGEDRSRLQKLAGPSITFLGKAPLSVLKKHYARCRALIFPGEEDFGIVPVEAMASGRPVIAYRRGGALDSVVEGRTGLFFDEPTADSLTHAVEQFEQAADQFQSAAIREHSRSFDRGRFKERIKAVICEWYAAGRKQ